VWYKVSALPSPIPAIVLMHASFSVGCDQTASKRAGGVHYEKRGSTALHFTHTPLYQPDSDMRHNTLALPLGCALGQPVRQASALV